MGAEPKVSDRANDLVCLGFEFSDWYGRTLKPQANAKVSDTLDCGTCGETISLRQGYSSLFSNILLLCTVLEVRQWQVIRQASASRYVSTPTKWVGVSSPLQNTALSCQGHLNLGILHLLLLISCALFQQWKISIYSLNFSWRCYYISDQFLMKTDLNGYPYCLQGRGCF